MSETSLTDLRGECEQAIVAAAREERAAHTALTEGSTPLHRNWCEEDKGEYEARLGRWRAASRTLVDALNRLGDLDERWPPTRDDEHAEDGDRAATLI